MIPVSYTANSGLKLPKSIIPRALPWATLEYPLGFITSPVNESTPPFTEAGNGSQLSLFW
jgi:hypothetical protein